MEWGEVLKSLGSVGGTGTAMVLGWWAKTLWDQMRADRVTCAAEIAKKDAELAAKDKEVQELNDRINELQEQRITDLRAIAKPST